MVPTIHAAGALVWRIHKERLEVLLIHRPAYDDWSWPKGKPRKRETLPACAVREVEEETGVRVSLGVPLPPVRYWLGDGSLKLNWYWAARAHDGPALAARRPVTPAPPTEVDEVRWVEAAAAMKKLTRKSDREPLKALLEAYADDHLETWAVLVARHGRAKKRNDWDEGELTRPLTGRGRRQARSLVELFAAYGARQVTSSVWGRCTSTVQPFADAASLEITALHELTEEGAREDPKAVRRIIRAAIHAGHSSVVCTHRPVLPLVVKGASKRASKEQRLQLPHTDPYLQPGEVFILHVGAGTRPRIVASEIQHPAE